MRASTTAAHARSTQRGVNDARRAGPTSGSPGAPVVDGTAREESRPR
ncbi:hypothetical protein GS506_01175 [Rhodococcus hoagii]|nr:hypothetical protein [Prescottella equi]